MPVIGWLEGVGQTSASLLAAFHKALIELGYIEGQNVAIEYRRSEQLDRLPALAAELVRRPVAVIFASGSANSAQAAKAATTTIPVVFANGTDPVRVGLVPQA
jgi:putative ABC transport system substrate-binding protein